MLINYLLALPMSQAQIWAPHVLVPNPSSGPSQRTGDAQVPQLSVAVARSIGI